MEFGKKLKGGHRASALNFFIALRDTLKRKNSNALRKNFSDLFLSRFSGDVDLILEIGAGYTLADAYYLKNKLSWVKPFISTDVSNLLSVRGWLVGMVLCGDLTVTKFIRLFGLTSNSAIDKLGLKYKVSTNCLAEIRDYRICVFSNAVFEHFSLTELKEFASSCVDSGVCQLIGIYDANDHMARFSSDEFQFRELPKNNYEIQIRGNGIPYEAFEEIFRSNGYTKVWSHAVGETVELKRVFYFSLELA